MTSSNPTEPQGIPVKTDNFRGVSLIYFGPSWHLQTRPVQKQSSGHVDDVSRTDGDDDDDDDDAEAGEYLQTVPGIKVSLVYGDIYQEPGSGPDLLHSHTSSQTASSAMLRSRFRTRTTCSSDLRSILRSGPGYVSERVHVFYFL